MSPVTAAKRAGLDWATLSKGQRDLVSRVTRAVNSHHDANSVKIMQRNMELADAVEKVRDAVRAIR